MLIGSNVTHLAAKRCNLIFRNILRIEITNKIYFDNAWVKVPKIVHRKRFFAAGIHLPNN